MKSTLPCLVLIIFVGGCFAADETVFNFTSGDFTILEKMNVKFSVPYTTKKDNVTKSVDLPFTDPTVNKGNSSANETHAVLALTFGNLEVNNLTQTFVLTNKTFSMVNMTVLITFDDKYFPDASRTNQTFVFNITEPVFEASVGRSYACDASVQMTNADNCTVFFTDVQTQPFKVVNGSFSSAEHCSQDLSTTTAMDMTTVETTVAPMNYDAKFNFTSDNHTCILEELRASFFVNYTIGNNKTMVHEVKLPSFATINETLSRCGDPSNNSVSAVLYVSWLNNSFSQEFFVKDKNFYLHKVELMLDISGFPNVTGPKQYKFSGNLQNNKTFRTPLGDSLACKKTQNVTFAKDPLVISFSNVRLQAYNITSNNYDNKYVCAADNSVSQIVPIIVGCALAVLVIIVLIAYLIGRRNSSKHGYESV